MQHLAVYSVLFLLSIGFGLFQGKVYNDEQKVKEIALKKQIETLNIERKVQLNAFHQEVKELIAKNNRYDKIHKE